MATGGPNPGRQIFPVILAVTVDGAAEVPEEEVASAVSAVLEERAR